MLKWFGAALFGAAMVVAASAQALVIEQVRNVSSDPVVRDTFDDFAQFGGPGTLLSVTLSWNIVVDADVTADLCDTFEDCDPADYSLVLAGSGDLAGANDSATTNSGIDNSTDTTQSGNITTGINNAFVFSSLTPFIGSGDVLGAVDVEGFYDGYFLNMDAGRSGTVTLTYEYQLAEIPEPGMAALFATGLALLGFAGWRRRHAFVRR